MLDEWNTVVHVNEYEGSPRRRPLSYDEVQRLFDAADDLVERARIGRRKGVLAAHRAAVVLKTVYAFGQVGALMVRWGKSSRGSVPKRRTVMLVPQMDWIVPALRQWIDELRPRFDPGLHPAMWVTERRGRLSMRGLNRAFTEARDTAGLDPVLDLHCLRHSYVTHMVEFDYPERFVQEQVGHAYAATTAIYTSVSDAYRNTLLRRSLTERNPDLWPDNHDHDHKTENEGAGQ